MPEPDFGNDWQISFDVPVPEETGPSKEELEKALVSIYTKIEPLIDNLCLRPEVQTINWPGRVDVLTKLKNELRKILVDVEIDVQNL